MGLVEKRKAALEAEARAYIEANLKRFADVRDDVDARWGPGEGVRALVAAQASGGLMSARVHRAGSLAWIHVRRPHTGQSSAWLVRHGGAFARLRDAVALAAILADGQPDVVAEADHILGAFQCVAFAGVVKTEADVEALRHGRYGRSASPEALARFEPPHFQGRDFVFVANIPWEARLVRVLVDAVSLNVRCEELGQGMFIPPPIGRNLVVDGARVLPPLHVLSAPGRPPPLAGVAHLWRQAARAEAASVPSFLRAAHVLARAGAPGDLVARSRAAAEDERAHARLSLEVAQALDGVEAAVDVDDGAIDAEGDDRGAARGRYARIAVDTFADAAVPETLAAAEARAALASCAHPVAHQALVRIAADEARHAALAWDVIAWAVLRDADAKAALAEIAPEAHRPVVAGGADVEGYGQLSEAGRAASARGAFAEVAAAWAQLTGGRHKA